MLPPFHALLSGFQAWWIRLLRQFHDDDDDDRIRIRLDSDSDDDSTEQHDCRGGRLRFSPSSFFSFFFGFPKQEHER